MRISIYFILFSCLSGTALAQNSGPPPPQAATAPTGPLTLQQVLDMARRLNPSLLSSAQHLAAVRSQEITAGLRQNPVALIGGQMVSLGPSNPNGPDFYQAGVQRLFERGGKRDLRLDNARSTTALTGFQNDDQRRETDLAVRQAFARMVFSQQALTISRDNLDSYRHTVQLMQSRLDAGAMDRTDFDRIELQLAGFESDYDNAQLNLQQASIALQTLLGMPAYNPGFAITGTLDPPAVTITLDDLHTRALAERPDLKAAEAQVQVNQSAIKLADANGKADPTIEGEYERSGNANTVGGNINIPLRIFDRNQGEKQRARYELESSRLAVTAARNQVLSDVDSAWAGYQTARTQSDRYRNRYLAEAAHVRGNLEYSYRNGNSTLLDYLSALSDYRQTNLSALDANLQLLLSLDQLSYAANTEILP